MTSRDAFRCWLLALALCVLAVPVCMAYVDRPVADFLEAHFRHTEFWVWLNRALQPLGIVVLGAFFFLFGCGVWTISGRKLPPWTEMPLLFSWSVIWAVATEFIFKRIFGRAWPDPSYVRDHHYGFHWLHGTTHWDSFPSGTAAVSTAIVSMLWIVRPRWRAAGLLVLVLLSIAIVVGNYHWVSDVIAGAFLGVTIGWATPQLLSFQNWPPME
jgi:membrane-associated phospholipid phosphatase